METVFRDEYGKVSAALIRFLRDFDAAEDAVAEYTVTRITFSDYWNWQHNLVLKRFIYMPFWMAATHPPKVQKKISILPS